MCVCMRSVPLPKYQTLYIWKHTNWSLHDNISISRVIFYRISRTVHLGYEWLNVQGVPLSEPFCMRTKPQSVSLLLAARLRPKYPQGRGPVRLKRCWPLCYMCMSWPWSDRHLGTWLRCPRQATHPELLAVGHAQTATPRKPLTQNTPSIPPVKCAY